MLFHWLKRFLRVLARLIIPPPPLALARIEVNARCPVCGHHRRGRLRTVEVDASKGGVPVRAILCQHACLICGARWFEKPIVNVDPGFVTPSIARDSDEEKEDAARRFGSAPPLS
jgi:hypothetical protein